MSYIIQLRNDTAANWASANPVLAVGESGYEIDTGIFKIGNGTSSWTALKETAGGPASRTLPAGAVQHFAMSTAPAGWLKANGSQISRTAYSSLFANIGTTYGTGNGSTTFTLPDLRGEFLRSWDDGRGVDSGRSFGGFQGMEWKGLLLTNTGQNTTDYTHGDIYIKDVGYNQGRLFAGGWAAPSAAIGGRFGGEEVRPRNISLLACIKF
jgi:phage-related tail fiber protein